MDRRHSGFCSSQKATEFDFGTVLRQPSTSRAGTEPWTISHNFGNRGNELWVLIRILFGHCCKNLHRRNCQVIELSRAEGSIFIFVNHSNHASIPSARHEGGATDTIILHVLQKLQHRKQQLYPQRPSLPIQLAPNINANSQDTISGY